MGGKGGWTILQDLGGGARVLTVDLNMSDMLEMISLLLHSSG